MHHSSDFRVTVPADGLAWHDFSAQFPNTVSLPLLIDPRRTADGVMPADDYKRRRQGDDVVAFPDELFKAFAELHKDDGPEIEQQLTDAEVEERLRAFEERLRGRILDFANRYGFLGIGCNLELFGVPVHAETLNAWHDASTKLHRAWTGYDLWKMSTQEEDDPKDPITGSAKRAAKERLEAFYKEDRYRIRRAFRNTPELLHFCDLADKESNHGPNMTNTESAVLAYVGSIVDKELRQFTSLGMVWSGKDKRLTTQRRTESLIGFLWLQLTERIENLKQFNYCGNCHLEIPIMNGERPDKAYCSERCAKAGNRKNGRIRKSYNRASSTQKTS